MNKFWYYFIWAFAVTINIGWGIVNIILFNDLIGITYIVMGVFFNVPFIMYRKELK